MAGQGLLPDGDLFVGDLVRLAARRPEDATEFARWSENALYMRLVDADYAQPISEDDYAERFRPGRSGPYSVVFHLRTLQEDLVIGFIAIHSIEWNNQAGTLSMGIGNPEYWDKGYGSDALRLMLRYAFHELNLYRLGLAVLGYNTRAIHAYEKAGFQVEGRQRAAVLRDGQRHDRVFMGILREEWQARFAR